MFLVHATAVRPRRRRYRYSRWLRRQAEADPALALWWQKEQELDRVIAQKLEGIRVPAGLKARLLQVDERTPSRRPTWPRKIALLVAAIVLLAVFFGSWRGLFQPAISLADYRDEMVGFIRLDPSLDKESSQMPEMAAFLKQNGAPSELKIPPGLEQLHPVGCRTLRFRGQNVALICFQRAPDDFVHLFVVNRNGMRKLRSKSDPQFAAQGDWMTASWSEDDLIYLITAKGSQESLAKYLGTT